MTVSLNKKILKKKKKKEEEEKKSFYELKRTSDYKNIISQPPIEKYK